MNDGLLERFEAYMNGLGHSEESRRLRRNICGRFLKQHDLATARLSGIVAFLGNPAWKAATRSSARAALKVLFKWAVLEGIREDNPMDDIPQIRAPLPPPRPAPETAISHGLAHAPDPRTRLVLLLGAYAGLRRAEIARLHADDIQENNTLRVFGKGGKTRIVPIHPLLKPHTDRIKQSGGWFFPSSHRDGPVATRTINRLLTGVLPPGFSTHTLRHRFATEVHRGSHDLRAVQALLGHSSLATTQRYVGVSDEALNDAVLTLPVTRHADTLPVDPSPGTPVLESSNEPTQRPALPLGLWG